MEILRGAALIVFLLPLLLGNKGCEKVTYFEHPAITQDMECSGCHTDGRTKKTRPPGHDLAWERNHGSWVKRYGLRQTDKCHLCHNETQCTGCHQREAPRSHTQFWRLRGHGLAVGLDREACFTCHRGADFCERCHAQTTPLDHTAAWGAPGNRHCLSCHTPIGSAGAQRCVVCHATNPSHALAPAQPTNGLHVAGANCRNCHTPLRHPDNGTSCTACHP